MRWMLYLSDFMIPFVFFYIIASGLMAGRPIYEDFIKGAKDGMKTVKGIMPTLIGLMVAVGVLRTSGFLEAFANLLAAATEKIGLPAPVLPIVLIKMFSSSAATGLVLDIFREYGTDSLIGRMVSVMMSCTETIFYTMSIYFVAAKVKKTRYTLMGALFTTIIGVIVSVILVNHM